MGAHLIGPDRADYPRPIGTRAPHPAPRSRKALPHWLVEALWALGTGAVGLAVAYWVMNLWEASLRVPLVPSGDAILGLAPIKGMLDNGWYLSIPQLAAPHGLELHDFTGWAGDLPQWAALRVLGVVITDPVLLMNAWFLGGFVAVGAASYVVLRGIGARRLTALVLGVLIAVLPYHFFQGEGHLMLAGYVAVPATCWLVMRILMGQALWWRRPAGSRWRHITWVNVGTVVAVLLTGATSLYYAIFGVLLIALAAIARGLAARRWRPIAIGAIVCAGTLVALGATMLPALAYRLANGPNPAAASRFAFESDNYSFSLSQVLFSNWWSRFSWLGSLGQRFADHSINLADPDVYLGLVFGATFVGALVAVVALTVRGRWPVGARSTTVRAAIVGAVFAFMLGSFGGLGSIIAHLISPQIRVWSRITPFLAFFCAIIAALAIDWARGRLVTRRGGVAMAVALPLLVGVVGVLDQTAPGFAPDHVANARLWRENANFVHEIEATMPSGASILQLPLQAFPEAAGQQGMGSYDHLFGYLASTNLRWSFGAMNGRPADWQSVATANGLSTRTVVINATAAGFDGVWLDRAGYADGGRAVDAMIASLTNGEQPMVSPNGRVAFYDLRPLRARLARTHSPQAITMAGNALVSPITTTYGDGFSAELANTTDHWRWAAHTAHLTLQNPASETHQVRWTATLQATPGARAAVWAGGRRLFSTVLPTGQGRLRVVIPAPPGATQVTVTSTGASQAPPGDTAVLSLDIANPHLVDTALLHRP